MQTILIAILLRLISPNSLFLYLLILVFVGGILVLFIYVTSIFPNEKFSFNQLNFFFTVSTLIFSRITLFLLSSLFITNLNLNNIFPMMEIKINTAILNTRKIFNSQNNLLLIFLVNYLFYCIIIVIKITQYFKGPLRKINYV